MIIHALTAAQPQVGKTTLANETVSILNEVYGEGTAIKLSFATTLKDEMIGVLKGPHVSHEVAELILTLDQTSAKDKPMAMFAPNRVYHKAYQEWLCSQGGKELFESMSWREHLIAYGTDYIRKTLGDETRWIRALVGSIIKAQHKGYKVAIIDDCRGGNEVHSLSMFKDTVFTVVDRASIEGKQTAGLKADKVWFDDYIEAFQTYNPLSTPEEIQKALTVYLPDGVDKVREAVLKEVKRIKKMNATPDGLESKLLFNTVFHKEH